MKKIKRIISLLLVIMSVLSFSACTVNTEKAKQKPVATVDDKEILKAQVDDIVGFTLVSYYASSSQSVDLKDDTVTSLKEQIVDNLIQSELIDTLKDEYDFKLDEKEVSSTALEALNSVKSSLKGDAYKTTLSMYGFTEESFEKAVNEYAALVVKLNGFNDAFTKKEQKTGKYTKSIYETVGDLEIPTYYIYYYTIQKQFEIQYNSYYSGGESSNEDTSEEGIYKSAIEEVTKRALYYNEGKKQNIKLSDKDIKDQVESLGYMDSMFGEDTVNSLCKTFCMTKKQYSDARKWCAMANLYKEQLEKDLKIDEVTEDDAKKEFKSNKDKYDSSTVSAKHILTQDKDLADEIYNAAKTNPANFDSFIEKYKDNEKITEATDLGEFSYSDMVEEFSKASFGAEKGSVVGPVKTEYGYHVIYVYDKNKVESKFEDYKEEIMANIRTERQNLASTNYESKLKKSTKTKENFEIKSPFDLFFDGVKKEHKIKIKNGVLKSQTIMPLSNSSEDNTSDKAKTTDDNK